MKLLLLAVLISSGMLVSLKLIQAAEPAETEKPPEKETPKESKEPEQSPNPPKEPKKPEQSNPPKDSQGQDNKPTKSPDNSTPGSFVNKNYNKLQLIINSKGSAAKKRKDEDSDEDEYDDYYYDLLSSMLYLGRKKRDTSNAEFFNFQDQILPKIPAYMKNIDLKENIVPDFEDFSGPRTLKYFMNDPSYYVKKTSGRLKRDVSEYKTDLENEPEVVGLPKNVLRFEINPRNTERSRKPSHLNVHEGKERLKRDALDDKRISENEPTFNFDKEFFNFQDQILPKIPAYMKNIDLKENIIPDFDDFIGPRTLKSFMEDPSNVEKTSGRLKRDVSEDKTDLENEPKVVGLSKNVQTFEINPRNTERSRKLSHLNVHEGKERLKRDAAKDSKNVSENESTSGYEDGGIPENVETLEIRAINSEGYRKPGGPRRPSPDDGMRGHRGPVGPKNDGRGSKKGDEGGYGGHGGCSEGCTGRTPNPGSGGKGQRRGAREGGFGGGEKGTGEGEKGYGGGEKEFGGHGGGRTPCENGGGCRGVGGCEGKGGCGGKDHKEGGGRGGSGDGEHGGRGGSGDGEHGGRGQGDRGGCKDCGDEGSGHKPGGAEPGYRGGDGSHGGGHGRGKRGKSGGGGGGKPCPPCEAGIPCPLDALTNILDSTPPPLSLTKQE